MSDGLTLFKLPTTFADGCWNHSVGTDGETDTWKKGQSVGSGTYGSLFLAEQLGSFRAVKEVLKLNTPDALRNRELLALIKLNSVMLLVSRIAGLLILEKYPEYFVRFFGWWEDDEYIFLSMEYIPGGDLMALIKQRTLTEDDATNITRQLLTGLEIMHENRICHRDLKPEVCCICNVCGCKTLTWSQNVLVVSLPPNPIIIKLADFGCAKYAVGTNLQSLVGTNGYIAPEVWGFDHVESSIYSFAVDLWSLGCLIYTVTTTKPPLQDFERYITFTSRGGPFPVEPLRSMGLSPRGISFIRALMAPLPDNRPSASDALRHPWLTGHPTSEYPDDPVTEAPSSFGQSVPITAIGTEQL